MSPRVRQAPGSGSPLRRAVVLTAFLSVIATLVAVAALSVVLLRGGDTAPTDGEDPTACRTAAWNALPDVAALPSGWAIASTRFPVDALTTTFVGPAPSGTTQGPATFVSVSCYGSDAGLAIAHDHEAALAAGSTDISFPSLGDETAAVTNTRNGSTTIYIRRGDLVADVAASTTLDQAALEAIARAVDDAMTLALSATPRPSSTPAAAAGGTPSPGAAAGGTSSPAASPAPSESTATPSETPAAASHVAPDLEALLPQSIDGTVLSTQSVDGSTALRADATSQALMASLAKLGKTAADFEIAAARDPTGTLPVQLLAFRVEGMPGSDLATAIVDSWMASTTETPTRSQVTIAGQELTKVGYSQGPTEYVFGRGGVAYDIETTDESLVPKVLALIK